MPARSATGVGVAALVGERRRQRNGIWHINGRPLPFCDMKKSAAWRRARMPPQSRQSVYGLSCAPLWYEAVPLPRGIMQYGELQQAIYSREI